MSVRLDSVERAIADIAAGKAVIVVDDEDRGSGGAGLGEGPAHRPQHLAKMAGSLPLNEATVHQLGAGAAGHGTGEEGLAGARLAEEQDRALHLGRLGLSAGAA